MKFNMQCMTATQTGISSVRCFTVAASDLLPEPLGLLALCIDFVLSGINASLAVTNAVMNQKIVDATSAGDDQASQLARKAAKFVVVNTSAQMFYLVNPVLTFGSMYFDISPAKSKWIQVFEMVATAVDAASTIAGIVAYCEVLHHADSTETKVVNGLGLANNFCLLGYQITNALIAGIKLLVPPAPLDPVVLPNPHFVNLVFARAFFQGACVILQACTLKVTWASPTALAIAS